MVRVVVMVCILEVAVEVVVLFGVLAEVREVAAAFVVVVLAFVVVGEVVVAGVVDGTAVVVVKRQSSPGAESLHDEAPVATIFKSLKVLRLYQYGEALMNEQEPTDALTAHLSTSFLTSSSNASTVSSCQREKSLAHRWDEGNDTWILGESKILLSFRITDR